MGDENRIALNLEALKSGRLLFREDELDQLILCMNESVNTYVYGQIGSGKTTAVKQTIEKFNNSRNKAFYVNCSTCSTEYSVLREIVDQINANFAQKIFIQTRSNYDLISRLKKERERFPVLKTVVLDNLRALSEPKVVDTLLEIGFNLILVSEEQKDINKVSSLAQSGIASTIHFSAYSPEQAVKILTSKARQIVGEESFKETVVSKIAQECRGNIGQGQSMLIAAVLRAMQQKKTCVDESDFPSVEKHQELIEDERLIVDILKEQNTIQSGTLYKLYCERTKFPKAERTFRGYLKDLAEKEMVKAVGTNKGRVYETK